MKNSTRQPIATAILAVSVLIAVASYWAARPNSDSTRPAQTQKSRPIRNAITAKLRPTRRGPYATGSRPPTSTARKIATQANGRSHLLPIWRNRRRRKAYKELLISQILHENGDHGPEYAALVMNVVDGNVSAVSEFLDSGGDPDTEIQLGSAPSASESLLEFAIESDQVGVVKELVNRGASFNKVASDGDPPLVSAALAGNAEVVEFLLNNGAEVNEQDTAHTTALSRAIESGSFTTVQLLLKNGASVEDALGAKRALPPELVNPANSEYQKIKNLLIEYGAAMPR